VIASKRAVKPEATESTYTDFAHTAPGTLAGRYLRRFWQPVYLARDLPAGWAKPLGIMSEDFTLYRGKEGAPHVVAFRCAHRGTQLSTGWVEGDCIRCFYHGWKYDSSGQCVEMPAEDPSFPPKVQIKSYPTEEYLGLIFAYLGEGEAPPLPRYPELEDDGVLEASSYTRRCNYFNNIDNSVDEAHVAFAHRDSQFTAAGLNWDVPRMSAEETDYGMVGYGTRGNGVVRVQPFLMPNILYIKGSTDDPNVWSDAFAWRVPIDDETHQSFNVRLIRITGEAARRYQEQQARRREETRVLPSASEISDAVLAGQLRIHDLPPRPDIVNVQDNVIQEGQGAIADRSHERLGRTDAPVILVRKLWARELRALAEGRPLTEWKRPARLEATSGV
jgi:5,5'-dehydrodivanillate O-demethylase